MLERAEVYVEAQKEELDIDTVNTMGVAGAISQKQLAEMHEKLQRLQGRELDREREWAIKEEQLKGQVKQVREEKAGVERQLYDTEFVMGEKDRELAKVKEDWIKEREKMKDEIKELQDKISFFRQNQKLLSDQDQETQSQLKDLASLRLNLSKLESEVKKTRDLEKKCKLLEETLKAKTPNSIPMML